MLCLIKTNYCLSLITWTMDMQVTIMEQMGLLDTTDEAAVKAVFDSIDEAVETINVSFVMHSSK